MKQPRLLVFAGPNGSGKSTITKGITSVGLYINADDIKRHLHCSDLEAAQMAEKLRENCVKNKADFTFETVLSTDRNLDLLRRAKKAGYEIMAIYVLTKSCDINVARVQERVSAGGHDVPEEKIRKRYQRSLQKLKHLIWIVDKMQIIDNSEDVPDRICVIENGIVEVFPSKCWTEEDILGLLSEREDS